MSNTTRMNGRASGTGQDTPLRGVCPCPAPVSRYSLARHGVTLSRPVPLSRIGCSWKATAGACRALLVLGVLNQHREAA